MLSLTMGFFTLGWYGNVVFAATIGATLVNWPRATFADAARLHGPLGEDQRSRTPSPPPVLRSSRCSPSRPRPRLHEHPARHVRVGTFIGIIPATFVYVNLGETLGRIDSLLVWSRPSALSSCSAFSPSCRCSSENGAPRGPRGHEPSGRIGRRLQSHHSLCSGSKITMHATLPLLKATDFPPIARRALDTLQVNLGYRCNQACHHCHVNASPDRKE